MSLSLLVGALLAHFEPAKICTPDRQGSKVEGHVIVPLKVSLIILYNRLWKISCASMVLVSSVLYDAIRINKHNLCAFVSAFANTHEMRTDCWIW